MRCDVYLSPEEALAQGMAVESLEVLTQPLNIEPEERFPTAKEMASALESRFRPASATKVAELVHRIAADDLRAAATILEAIEAGRRPPLLRVGFAGDEEENTDRLDAEAGARATEPAEKSPGDASAPRPSPRSRAGLLRVGVPLTLLGSLAVLLAARATRERKVDVDRKVLRREWSERARDLGIDFGALRARSLHRELGETRRAADRALELAVAHLVERKVIASERKLLQVGLGFGVGTIRLSDLERALERKIERGELVSATSSS